MHAMTGPEVLTPPTVLIIEDEEDVARTMELFLSRTGMRVAVARTGAEALTLQREISPDVVLVDLSLPDTNGINLITWLVREASCGIIVVSGSSEEAERVVGIEVGADDYIVKPPPMRELAARIRAVHRRVALRASTMHDGPAVEPEVADEVLMVGGARIDMRRHQVTNASGQLIPLTSAEFRTLALLIEGKGEPVSRDRICETVLNRKLGFEDRSVDQLILNIRKKLGGEDDGRRMISSVRGAGYALHA